MLCFGSMLTISTIAKAFEIIRDEIEYLPKEFEGEFCENYNTLSDTFAKCSNDFGDKYLEGY